MKANDFQQKIQLFTNALVQDMPQINEAVALNAYALVRDRIINDGVTGTGKSLGQYSETPLPLFFYTGKSLNAGGDAAIANAKKNHVGLSYKDFREANNRPTDHVTLNFSGDMWGDIGVVKNIVSGTKIVTVIGAKNTKNRKSGNKSVTTDDIMDGLFEHYGDFLEVNDKEESLLAQTYDAKLQQLIDKVFS